MATKFVYLLLQCSAHEGCGIYGVFETEEEARAGFEELAEAERAMALDAGMPLDEDDDIRMRLDWDDGDGAGPMSGWAIRGVMLNELYASDVGMSPP